MGRQVIVRGIASIADGTFNNRKALSVNHSWLSLVFV
jgi:hypothetical protein